MKKFLFFALLLCVLQSSIKAQFSDCNNWLYTPTLNSTVTIGDLDVTGDQITVEALINITGDPALGVPNGGKLISKGSTGMDINYALFANGCEITTDVDPFYRVIVLNTTECPHIRDRTYHIAMVYDGAALRFYRNGFLMDQLACTGNLVTNNLITTIAQLAGPKVAANQFSGHANEIRIWNVARTQAQINAFMDISLPNPTTQTGLLAYYQFDNLLNKQGNATFNAALNGGSVINQTNPNCNFIYDSCGTIVNPPLANCADSCYWKVTGNNIANGHNIFGTLTNHNVRIQTNSIDRGIFTSAGHLGWNTMNPTTNFSVNSAGHPTGVPSGVRLENLDPGAGNLLVIDSNGYVFNSGVAVSGSRANNFTQANLIPKGSGMNGNLTASQVFDNGSSVGINTTSGFAYGRAGKLPETTSPSTSGTFRLDVAGVTRSLDYIANSDERLKSNIKPLEDPLAIINSLKGKTYNWNETARKEFGTDNSKQYGFLTQEVKEILPEAVVIDEKGNYGLTYNTFIPLLTEGQKELYKLYLEEKAKNEALAIKVEELSAKIDQLSGQPGNSVLSNTNETGYLKQNVPNPFDNMTRIEFVVKQMKSFAYIMITDLNGKEIKRYSINSTATKNINFDAQNLPSGLYVYTLIVDGKVVDSKKMALAK